MDKKLYVQPLCELVVLKLNHRLMDDPYIPISNGARTPEQGKEHQIIENQNEMTTSAKVGWKSYNVWDTWE